MTDRQGDGRSGPFSGGVSLGNLVSWVMIAVGGISAAAVLMYRVDTMAVEMVAIKSQVLTQQSTSQGFESRLVRLETRMDTIIEQNASILSELRR